MIYWPAALLISGTLELLLELVSLLIMIDLSVCARSQVCGGRGKERRGRGLSRGDGLDWLSNDVANNVCDLSR